MTKPRLTPEQRTQLANLEALLSSADPEVAHQGSELALALGDPDLLAAVADGCWFDERGKLQVGKGLKKLVKDAEEGLDAVEQGKGANRNTIALELVLGLIAAGVQPLPPCVDLAYMRVGARGASALARAESLRGVASLDLRYCRIGDEGARALAGAAHFGGITALHLQSNAIGDDGARALAGSPHLRGLTLLDLRYNPIGKAGAAALAASEHLAGLTRLQLHFSDVGPHGARALGQSKFLPANIRRYWKARAKAA
jgi:hypothetical protein